MPADWLVEVQLKDRHAFSRAAVFDRGLLLYLRQLGDLVVFSIADNIPLPIAPNNVFPLPVAPFFL